MRFSAKMTVDLNPSPAVHGRVTLLAVTSLESLGMCQSADTHSAQRNYGHEQAWHDGNGHSHLQGIRLGPSLTVSNSDSKLVLGTWQQLFHLKCAVRGRERTIVVAVIGDERQSTRK